MWPAHYACVCLNTHCLLDRSRAFRGAEGDAECRGSRSLGEFKKAAIREISLGSLTPGRRRLG